MFAQMFRITLNKSSHILHHIHVFIISRYNWSTMRVTRITLFAPRIFLQVSVLFWTILYPSSELNLFQNTFLLSLFSLQVSVLFWTVLFRSEFPYPSPEPNPSRTKSLPEHSLSALLILFLVSLFCSDSVLNFPYPSSELNLFQNYSLFAHTHTHYF